MIRIISLLFLLGLPIFCMAQKIVVSEDIELKDDNVISLLGNINGNIILFRGQSHEQALHIYDENLRFKQNTPITLEEQRITILGICASPIDFTIFYTFKNKGTEYLKASKHNHRGKVLFQDTLSKEKVFLSKIYEFESSENERYVVLHYPEGEHEITFFVYDCQEMKTIDLKHEALDKFNIRKDLKKIQISNNGLLAMLFEKYNNDYRIKDHFFEIHSISTRRPYTIETYPLPNKLTINAKMVFDDHLQFFNVYGLYGENYNHITEGFFVLKEQNVQTTPFSKENSKRTIQNINKNLENFKLTDVIARVDGGAVLVLEVNKEYFRSNTAVPSFSSVNSYRSNIDYYAEDMLLVSVDPVGSINWQTILPKRQVSQDDFGMYSSYFLFKTNSKLRFIFNDEIKNNNTVSEYIVNPRGIFKRNALLSTAYKNLSLRLRNAIQISNDTVLLTSEKRNIINLVMLKLQ